MKRRSFVPVAYVTAILGAVACGGPAGLDPMEGENIETSASGLGTFNVLTRNYNVQRNGANNSETVLGTSNVNATQFGRRFQLSVDDQVYAGLLYASSVSIAGGTHNVLYVATVNNSVYAFDADTGGAPLWQRNFNGSGRPVNHTDVGISMPNQPWCNPTYPDFSGNIGIVGTPVIDGTAGTMYFVTRTVEAGSTFIQRLRAINITTGVDVTGSPKTVAASVPGTGDGSIGGNVAFNPRTNNQRAALGLAGNNVYIAWAGHCDVGPYHGWVMAYAKDMSGVNPAAVFNTTPNGFLGGIWQSGGGPLIDGSGNVFYATGNGANDAAGTTPGFGNGVVKLNGSTLGVLGSFTASDWQSLNTNDNDLGSGGPSFVPPNNTRIFTGGKTGLGYLLDASNMTLAQSPWQVIKNVKGGTHHVHSSSTYWQSPQGLNMYVWGENDFLRVYRFNATSQTFNTTEAVVGSVVVPPGGTGVNNGMPGGFMVLSSNGTTAGTGILWATTPEADANHATVAGTFRAFNAETLAQLWDSTGTGNGMGNLAKYNPPVVAQGRVYVPSFSNTVSVYGLAPTGTQAPYLGTPWAVPGTIQAENYDTGGQGVAYSDSESANQGGQYRADGVDIQATTDTGAGFNVGWTAAGEWLEYTVNAAAGPYTLKARVAAVAAGSLGVQLDGASIGTIDFTNTGGWQTWQTFTASGTPTVSAGSHVVRVTINSGCNLNWISFTSAGTGQAPFNGTPWPVPGTIQAENYDTGGQGVAYSDSETANQGAQYRTDGVDIEATTDTGTGFNVGWTAAAEWLEFTVNVTSVRSSVNLRVASGVAGNKTMHLEMDPGTGSAVILTGPITFSSSAGWQSWSTITAPVTGMTTGSHVFRLVFETSGTNLNWISF